MLGRKHLLDLAGEVVDSSGELGLARLDHRRVKGAAYREEEAEALLGQELEAERFGMRLDLLVLESKRAEIVGAARKDLVEPEAGAEAVEAAQTLHRTFAHQEKTAGRKHPVDVGDGL